LTELKPSVVCKVRGAGQSRVEKRREDKKLIYIKFL